MTKCFVLSNKLVLFVRIIAMANLKQNVPLAYCVL